MSENSAYSFLIVTFVTLIWILVLCMCLDMFIKYRFLRKYARNTPYVPYLPVVGFAHLFIGQKILAAFQRLHEKMNAPCFFGWFFHVPYYFTIDPVEIKEILTNPNILEKGFMYDLIKPTLGDSLLTVEAKLWKKYRRSLSRLFSQKTLEGYVPIIDRMTDNLVERIQYESSDKCLDVAVRVTMDTFMETFLNIKLQEVTLDCTSKYFRLEIYKFIKRLEQISTERVLKLWSYPDIIFFNTKAGKEFRNINQTIMSVLDDIIEDKRKMVNEEVNVHSDCTPSFIEILIQENMTNEEIVGEIKLFATAASQTSALTVIMACILLAIHPDIQERVFKEVVEVLGLDGPIEYKSLLNLNYTEMVLQESLRLFPPVPFIGRQLSADIDIGKKLLPKGTNIFINVFRLQRSEDYWEDPLKFNPDRFLPKEVEKRSPFTFLPLAAGPRNCIGGKYSTVAMKIMLAKLMRNYRVSSKIKSVEDVKLDSYFTLLIENVDCTFIPRQ